MPLTSRPHHRDTVAPTEGRTNGKRRDWRCHACAKLLGRLEEGRLHLRLGRGHEYLVALPATATCRGCGALNALDPQPASPDATR